MATGMVSMMILPVSATAQNLTTQTSFTEVSVEQYEPVCPRNKRTCRGKRLPRLVS
jgi:hypothetical protein